MSLKSILRELKEVKDGIGSISRRSRAQSHIAPDQTGLPPEIVRQSPWANLPPELLFDIISRLEESEDSWPARAVVVSCASVCKTWREITKEIVKSPEQCRRLTFPISLKQPGPLESPIHCFIKRDRAASTYLLYCGLVPSDNENDKLLLAARKIKRAARTEYVISLSANNFSRGSSTYFGKLRSGFLGTKFSIYDGQSPSRLPVQSSIRSSRRCHSKQISPRNPTCSYMVGTVTYELNVLRTRGPRKMRCFIDSIPISSTLEGSTTQTVNEQTASQPTSKKEVPFVEVNSTEAAEMPKLAGRPLVLKNKAPRWHEQLQCWCLNFKGRVTVASVKNFQLVAEIDPSLDVSAEEHERVILQFGKIGRDIFTMDYSYPLSAFQAFAICISSFDTKPACEG